MSWTIKIGTFRGIAVRVHPTFLLLLGWVLLGPILSGNGIANALNGAAFTVLLFTCVVLHEFGHALTAQRYGVKTRDITLYPIGGIARLERIPREPRHELWIALAGPAVNGLIALLLAAFVVVEGTWSGGPPAQFGRSMPEKLLLANTLLALFNLLPAFPMDGGRVLRALLAGRMDYGRATQMAATVGQGMAFLFALVGLLHNPMLLFIALFVYVGAMEEAATVQTELAFRAVPACRAMMTRFETLSPADTLNRAMELLLASSQHDFPIIENGVLVGILTRTTLFEVVREKDATTPVAEVMRPQPGAIPPDESLEAAFYRMQETESQALPVVENGSLVGLITLENIAEFVMLRQALEGKGGGSQGGGRMPLMERVAEGWLAAAAKPTGM